MTLDNVIDLIKNIALLQPNVNSATEGSIYEALNTTSEVNYANVHITQSKHIESADKQSIVFNFILFYTDRLLADKSNKVTIHSTGINVLKNILRTIEEKDEEIEITSTDFQTYTEQFSDICAGVFSNISLTVPIEYNCAEVWGDIDKVIGVNVKNEYVEVDVNENGQLIVTYDHNNYTGIERVIINTNVPKSYLSPLTVEMGENAFTNNQYIKYSGVVDVEYGGSMKYMFSKCYPLISVEDVRSIKEDVKNTSFMFYKCPNLEKVYISGKGYENVDKTEYMFADCQKLREVDISGIHFSPIMQNKRGMFDNCSNLENLKLQNIPPYYTIDWGFETCTKLTVDSLMNIINALEDAWNFVNTNGKECILILGEENIAKLTEEQLKIGRDKGWSII